MTPFCSLFLHLDSWRVEGSRKAPGSMTASCTASLLFWWSVTRYNIDTAADKGHSSSSSASSSPSAELLHHWQLLAARSQLQVLTTLGLFSWHSLSACSCSAVYATCIYWRFTKSESQEFNKSVNINKCNPLLSLSTLCTILLRSVTIVYFISHDLLPIWSKMLFS